MNQYETTEARILSALSSMRSEPEFTQERLDEIKKRCLAHAEERKTENLEDRVRLPNSGIPHYSNEVEGEEDIVYG